MNRRQRKALEKSMGILKHRKNETHQQKFDRFYESAESSKKVQEEMEDARRVQENQANEQQQSTKIAYKATELMVQEGLSLIPPPALSHDYVEGIHDIFWQRVEELRRDLELAFAKTNRSRVSAPW